jgi:hypothetical protein
MKYLYLLFLLISQTLFSVDQAPTKVHPNSLLVHAHTIYSQYGEEGILDHILTKLNIKKGFFIEFGGWDAKHLSNTRFLAERGWKGAFIEADEKLSKQAQENCKGLDVLCISEFVTWPQAASQGKTLDQIADRYFPNQEIDVLSIDIDGPDFLILENLKRRPKVIVMEGGICWSPYVTKRMPDLIAKQEVSQPLHVICEIAKKKGYRPVCFTINTFFVREDLFKPFENIVNDPVTLWFDSWHYYKERAPEIANYFRSVRVTRPLLLQYDPFSIP